ncbi:protein of unknown function [Acidithiobacillus ferrivorans]|uniref:ATPase AAA-type core domain-containing protein n=1 Tax=Acidithiobacillus ferrivorans TaxID=160808 RepID=A0A060UZQ3_9PROT|nr:hypothetical protein AFERRI_600140 [Acidithiobacillus ferrivorans]SMH65470.1 protein of unknown function [Acidithiobacillus ferrivorans]
MRHTHFNDAWKRDIVNVVDGALGKDASAVLIATHSAIVLSDVFDEEIVLIKKRKGVRDRCCARAHLCYRSKRTYDDGFRCRRQYWYASVKTH